MITVRFKEEHELKAKALVAEKDKEIPDNRFGDDRNRWIGELGEWAVKKVCKDFLKYSNEDDWLSLHDFRHRYTDEKIEVKTRSGNYDVGEDMYFSLNAGQVDSEDFDILIHCYYHLPTKRLTIVGWITREDYLDCAKFYKKGEDVLTLSGRKCYTALTDLYDLPAKYLTALNALKHKITT